MKLLAIIILTLPFLGVSQPIKGNYEYTDHANMSIYRIKLLDSFRFVKSSGLMLGHGSFLGKGYYTQNKDTIELHFESYNRPQPYYEIISKDTLSSNKWDKNDPSNTVSISINLFEDTKIPLRSLASLVDLISNNSFVATISTDEQGRVEFFTTENLIDELGLRSLGFEQLKIPLRDFRGFRTCINVYLTQEDNNDYRESGEEKYLLSKNGGHLQFLNDDDSLGIKYTKSEYKN
ncbi:MAG: hypothetical protein HKN51_09975 [Saprospiraceae bacterium]|nr:hypothetical protein [Saprospiraceae bacterium]